MTYATIINTIQLTTLNDPVAPAPGSQEYLMYSQLIANMAIPAWENERGVLWQELVVPEPSYATLKAGAPTANTIALPGDFKFIYDGQITITYSSGSQQVYKVKALPEQMFNPYSQVREFYVSGNPPNSYSLTPGWTINATDPEVGATVSFRYYKHAALPILDATGNLTDTNDVPEMSDPNFIIYKVGAQVSMANYNANMYQVLEDKANYSMAQMRLANEMPSNYEDNYIKDADHLLRHQGRYRNPHITPNSTFNY